MGDYDIGMVRVFVHVYETQSATDAAERLFITQPSVSYSLTKLRKKFGDPLFVRSGQGIRPTPLADELYPRLRELLLALDAVMDKDPGFDPATSAHTFRLQMSDVGVAGLLPKVLQRVTAEAPSVTIEIEPLLLSAAADALRLGRVHAVICTPLLRGTELERLPLFTQRYVGVCRRGHPRIGRQPTLAEYEAERHIGVATEIGHRAVDESVLEQGIERKISVQLPSFSGLPSVLDCTDLLSFAPKSYAQRLAALGQCQIFELPFDVPLGEVAWYALRRQLPSPALEWLGALVYKALAS